MNRYYDPVKKELYESRIVKDAALLLAAVVLVLGCFGTVKAGERGVRLRFSAVVGTVNEGLYFKIPIIENVVKLDVKTQKDQTQALAYSKDIQSVDATIALNYHLAPELVTQLWKEIGIDYVTRVIDPAVQESVKAATAQFTAQELIEQRPKVKDAIKEQLAKRLEGRHIVVEDFSIINFDFSDEYEQAVEQKQVSQQNALKAENDLQRIKVEAEQRIAQAQAEAEAIKIQAQAITQQGGQAYVDLQAISKWDGHLPQYMLGNSTPFINLNK